MTERKTTLITRALQSLYKINVDAIGYDGSLAEKFSNHNDTKLPTYDRDNDVHYGVNCA